MGWNSKTFTPISYSVNWKDPISDSEIDEFEVELKTKVEAFIAGQIRCKFWLALEKGQMYFRVGE
jgi:hypothetical protein